MESIIFSNYIYLHVYDTVSNQHVLYFYSVFARAYIWLSIYLFRGRWKNVEIITSYICWASMLLLSLQPLSLHYLYLHTKWTNFSHLRYDTHPTCAQWYSEYQLHIMFTAFWILSLVFFLLSSGGGVPFCVMCIQLLFMLQVERRATWNTSFHSISVTVSTAAKTK